MSNQHKTYLILTSRLDFNITKYGAKNLFSLVQNVWHLKVYCGTVDEISEVAEVLDGDEQFYCEDNNDIALLRN